jgi:hypothetical protein
MATYPVTSSPDDLWGQRPSDRPKTRREANILLEQARAAGRFAQLVRWDWVRYGEGRPTIVARVDERR